eukprot:3167146-Rhodomonas_salina.1
MARQAHTRQNQRQILKVFVQCVPGLVGTETQTQRKTDAQPARQTDRQTPTYIHTDRQTDRHADRTDTAQTPKLTHTYKGAHLSPCSAARLQAAHHCQRLPKPEFSNDEPHIPSPEPSFLFFFFLRAVFVGFLLRLEARGYLCVGLHDQDQLQHRAVCTWVEHVSHTPRGSTLVTMLWAKGVLLETGRGGVWVTA